jgi:hypothetical protein
MLLQQLSDAGRRRYTIEGRTGSRVPEAFTLKPGLDQQNLKSGKNRYFEQASISPRIQVVLLFYNSTQFMFPETGTREEMT